MDKEECDNNDNNNDNTGVSICEMLLRKRLPHRIGYIQVRCLNTANMACECESAYSQSTDALEYTCVSLKLGGYTATDIASGPMWMMPTVRTTVP